MLKIRLKRIGRKGQAYYRVVVMESTKNRDGKSVADLGAYNPHASSLEETFNINKESAATWLTKGAQPSETVAHFFVKLGLVKGVKKGSVQSKGKSKKKEAQAS